MLYILFKFDKTDFGYKTTYLDLKKHTRNQYTIQHLYINIIENSENKCKTTWQIIKITSIISLTNNTCTASNTLTRDFQ